MKLTHMMFIGMLFSIHVQYAKKALIFGISGQDGIYLTDLLLNQGYAVHGVTRDFSHLVNLKKFLQRHGKNINQVTAHLGNLTDREGIQHIINEVQPDEIYNLGAQTNVPASFEHACEYAQVNGLGCLHILDAIKGNAHLSKTRVFQALSAEIFGKSCGATCDEQTALKPCTPYGASKLFAYNMIDIYRNTFGIFGCCAILFNHESPMRGAGFLPKIVAKSISDIHYKKVDSFSIGNLDCRRDWGYAHDYVYAMWLMMQQEKPDDYVIATGQTYSVRELIEESFKHIGKSIVWQGSGLDEVGIDSQTKKVLVTINPKFYRTGGIDVMQANPTKAITCLGWDIKTDFSKLVKILIDYELSVTK